MSSYNKNHEQHDDIDMCMPGNIYLGSREIVGKQATQRQCSWYVLCVQAILMFNCSSYSPGSTAMNLNRTVMLLFGATTHRLGGTLLQYISYLLETYIELPTSDQQPGY